ncbi:hypothetical protein ARMGADRAFT_1088339 [Armillaria gallica]|uniref:Uncharacterized protein n=1 Tax=Armillaria gallica TaxID=47427 RepID=A0A2H3D1B9_ARMGA|nr:hypothetical protein ARMGADRAFT_1088339 [Armillaria gallica]
MTDTDYAYALNTLVPSRRILPQKKRHFWAIMKDAIQNRKTGKQVYKPEDIPAVTSALDMELTSLSWVPASPGNTQISDSEVDKQYSGPTTWDFMTTDIDLSNSTTRIFDELEMYRSSFNVQLNSQELRSGLQEARKALEKLERLADWMDTADLRQWAIAEEEHKRLWLGWQKFVGKESNDI